MMLDERKKNILESVIKDYVETAEPVGSRAVVKKHKLKISAATVRNEMADLEEMGYLEQPHTSAGRIPSESGFRYYVDCMMEKERLCNEEIDLLYTIIQDNIQEWDKVIHHIGNFLSGVTNYASFIVVPSVKSSDFKFLQVIPIEQGKALLILVTDIGIIMHRKIDIPESIVPEDLYIIGKLFNQAFQGKKLEQINRTDLQLIRDNLKKRRQVIDTALDTIDGLVGNYDEEQVIISGALNILNQPEFKDLDKLKRILTLLEEDVLLKKEIHSNRASTEFRSLKDTKLTLL